MLGIALVTTLLCTSAIVGDILVNRYDDKLLKAVLDNGTHAVIGCFTWLVVSLRRKVLPPASELILQTSVCTILASLIDIDHFIAAKSLRLQDVHRLERRPFMHCTSLAIGIVVLLIVFSHFIWDTFHCIGWIWFCAVFSHHTRDAQRRGYWLYPFESTPPLNYWLYLFITAATPYIVEILFNATKPVKLVKRVINMGDYYSLV